MNDKIMKSNVVAVEIGKPESDAANEALEFAAFLDTVSDGIETMQKNNRFYRRWREADMDIEKNEMQQATYLCNRFIDLCVLTGLCVLCIYIISKVQVCQITN